MVSAPCAALAQSAEHFTRNEKVKGSIPLGGSIMTTAVDLVLEVFTWVGFGGAAAAALACVIAWAADGTWLPADAIVDREGDDTVVRWLDDDGDVNRAVASHAEAQALAGQEGVRLWYRLGWAGRMRLTRRSPALTRLLWAGAGLLALGILSLAAGVVLYFAGG